MVKAATITQRIEAEEISEGERIRAEAIGRRITEAQSAVEHSKNDGCTQEAHRDTSNLALLNTELIGFAHMDIKDVKRSVHMLAKDVTVLAKGVGRIETAVSSNGVKSVRIKIPFGTAEIPVEGRDVMRLAVIALIAFLAWMMWGLKTRQQETQRELRAIGLPQVAVSRGMPGPEK